MRNAAYFVTSNRAIRVANDNGRMIDNVQHLPPQMQTTSRRNRLSEMVLFVEEGVVEFMIGGAAGIVTAGSFVRIPADVPFAYRNAGEDTARLVSRTVTSGKSTITAA